MAAQGRARKHIPVAHRNLFLISIAASFAHEVDASSIVLALNGDDLGTYSSASRDFLTAVQQMLQVRAYVIICHPVTTWSVRACPRLARTASQRTCGV